LDILKTPAVDLDDPVGDRVPEGVRGDVVGFSRPPVGEVRLNPRLDGKFPDETLHRARGETIARARGEQRRRVLPPIPEIAPEDPRCIALEAESRGWGRSAVRALLNLAREVYRPGVEIDVVDIKAAQLLGAKAGVIGERDERLVSVLKIRRDGVGETDVPELFDLLGLQPCTRPVGAVAIGVLANVGIA